MSKSRKWRKAMLEWLKEMWRNCVGCNTKYGEWTIQYPEFEVFIPLLVAKVILSLVTIIVLILVIFLKCGG